jgi:hypothetical protein
LLEALGDYVERLDFGADYKHLDTNRTSVSGMPRRRPPGSCLVATAMPRRWVP